MGSDATGPRPRASLRVRSVLVVPAAVVSLLLLGAAACDPYACLEEARNVDTEGVLTREASTPDTTGLTGVAAFGATEFRGPDEQRLVLWHVRVPGLTADSVDAVELWEGAPGDGGRFLYDVPVEPTVPSVVTASNGARPYEGSVPYGEVFAALWEGRGHLLLRRNGGVLHQTDLQVVQKRDWHDALCS